MMQHHETGEIKVRRVINLTTTEIVIPISESLGTARKVSFPPRRFVELPAAYALPQATSPGRDPRPSVIDQLTGGKVVDEGDPRAKDAVKEALEYDKKVAAAMADVDKKMGR